jgi:hypothetical protein
MRPPRKTFLSNIFLDTPGAASPTTFREPNAPIYKTQPGPDAFALAPGELYKPTQDAGDSFTCCDHWFSRFPWQAGTASNSSG